jgi:hypothetical protein
MEHQDAPPAADAQGPDDEFFHQILDAIPAVVAPPKRKRGQWLQDLVAENAALKDDVRVLQHSNHYYAEMRLEDNRAYHEASEELKEWKESFEEMRADRDRLQDEVTALQKRLKRAQRALQQSG